MELKPVRNTKICRTDIEEAERLWDAHATGRRFANGANRPGTGIGGVIIVPHWSSEVSCYAVIRRRVIASGYSVHPSLLC